MIVKSLKKVKNISTDLLWSLNEKHHNIWPLSRFTFPFLTSNIYYKIKKLKIDSKSDLKLYKLKNLLKPRNHYTFYNARKKKFVEDNYNYDLEKNIHMHKKNIDINLKKAEKKKFKKPIFFLYFCNNYGRFIEWNFFAILFLIKNKINFILGVHEDYKKYPKFNLEFISFFKKYFNLSVIFFNSNKSIYIQSEIILFSNHIISFPLYENFPQADQYVVPNNFYQDLPKLLFNNKKLKKFYGKPKNKIVLISRTNNRIISNENDLLKKFSKIEQIIPEKLSIEEEISFCYHASIVIGTYGAALSNLWFSRPGTIFIRLGFKNGTNDIRYDAYKKYGFWELVNEQNNIKTFYINGSKLTGKINDKNTSFKTNIKEITKLLNKLKK